MTQTEADIITEMSDKLAHIAHDLDRSLYAVQRAHSLLEELEDNLNRRSPE